MSYEPVDIYLKDQLNDPVVGVLVRIYNPSGSVFYTQGTTDADGHVGFLLDTQQYSMRFYRFQTTVRQPQAFTVLASPAVNTFDVAAETYVPPVANDARLCRCAGYFRDVDGSAQEYLDLTFLSEFQPVLLEGSGVIPRPVTIRTDDEGFASIDLIRGGRYRVTIEAMEGAERCIRVPDQAGVNLPDLLFPVVDSVTFTPEPPYSLAIGVPLELTPVVLDTAGVPLTGTAQLDIDWSVSDPAKVGLTVNLDKLVIVGLAAGSAEIRVTRRDKSIVVIPAAPVSGVPASVTVT